LGKIELFNPRFKCFLELSDAREAVKALIVANQSLERNLRPQSRLATREGSCSTWQSYCRAIGTIGMIELGD
jgi:hypothetical protein